MRFQRARSLTTRPVVSVVIPCYNYGHFLPGCVASVLSQPGVDLDVIIVDDCSTDGSAEVATRIGATDPRVRVIVHEQNRGHIATYNDGLAEVRGDYVVLLSADDLLTPGSLSRSVALMEALPDVALVYGYPVSFHDVPPVVGTRVSSWSVWTGEEWLRRVCARGRNIIVNPEAVLRRSVLDQIGGYEPEHPHAADMKLWMKAAARGRVGRVNGPAQAFYREHGASMHNTQFAGVLTDLRESHRVFTTFFVEGEVAPVTGAELQRTAERALAREALLLAGVSQAARAHDSGPSAGELARFALDCRPSVRGSRRWRAYERRSTGALLPGEARVLTQAFDARWRVRWRRWRRFGT